MTTITTGPRAAPTGDGAAPARRRGPSPARARRAASTLPAEIALTAVSLSAVLGLGRLFADGSFLPSLVVIAIGGHVAAALVRRSRVNAPIAAALGLVSGFVVIVLVRYPGTTLLGLPRADSYRMPIEDLRLAWHQFAEVVAPAPVTAGFVLASAIAIWCVAWFSDWAAFRLGAVVEATLPAGAIFLFGAMLGAERQRVASSAAFVLAVLAFVLVHTTNHRARRTVWVGNGSGVGMRSIVRLGLGIVALATVVGMVAGPHLPGATSASLLDWKGNRNQPATRITVSPLVDIRKRLVDQSDTVVFTVKSSKRAYWRLTSLDTFDGVVWSSGGSFARADGDLAGAPQPSPAAAVTQSYAISGLAAIWLPAAYSPASIKTDGTKVRWDDESDTLIVDSSSANSDDMDYTVVSNQPTLTGDELNHAEGDIPAAITSRYLEMPTDFPRNIRSLAEDLTNHSTSTYNKALALQNYFRTYTYDLTGTQSGHSDQAIESFIESKRGYCEQFAGTFAAMARSIGIPARVAVGFTPGDVDPARKDTYIVKGKHAHAWPEVWIYGQGWVAFEPTPGRGIPGAQSYTGVKEAQTSDGTGPSPSTSTTVAAGPEPTAGETQNTRPTDAVQTKGGSTGGSSSSGPSAPTQLLRLIVLAIVAAAVWALGLALSRIVRQRRRRTRATDPGQRVRVAWLEGAEAVANLAAPLDPAETEREFASRSRSTIGPAGEPLDRLAVLASVAQWSDAATDDAVAHEADVLSATVHREVRAQMGWRQKLRRVLDPRIAFPR